MSLPAFHLFISCCLLCILAGCATPPHRARQYSERFNSLDAASQKRVLERQIQPGDSREMVYIALGGPTRQRLLNPNAQYPIERWEYLGKLQADETDANAPKKILTSNDFVVTNPFKKSPFDIIAIDFQNERVLLVSSRPNSEQYSLNQRAATMILPQNLHTPAPDEPTLGD